MDILKEYFNFSIKRIVSAFICFMVLFFIITYLFNLPVKEKTGLKTDNAVPVMEVTGAVSDNNVVVQSIFFHKPVKLNSMDILVSCYDGAVSMKELKYHIKDKLGQYIYSSSVPVDSVTDNSWLHLDMGDVIFKAGQRYFVQFQGPTEDENTVCPSFYLMEDNQECDVLYTGGGTSVAGRALCATFEYDIIPMGKGAVLFFILLLLVIIITACLKKEFIKKNFSLVFKGAWIIFWGILFAGVLFNNNPANKTYFNQTYAVLCFLSVLIIIILASLAYRKFKKDNRQGNIYSLLYNHRGILGIVFFALLFAVQLVIITNIYQKIGYDVGASWDNAFLWRTDANAVSDWALLTYPNNIGITSVMYFLQLFASGMKTPGQYLFVVIVNTLFVDFGIYMAYKVSYKLKGFTVAATGTLLLTVLIGISGWIVVPYTDTVTFWIPVTIMYLYIFLEENSLYGTKPALAAAAIGLLAVLGYYLKPQCVIVLIAIVLEELYKYIIQKKNNNIKERTKKTSKNNGILKNKFILMLFGGAAGLLLHLIIGSFILPDDFTSKNSMPASHFVMMGLSESPYGGIGNYFADDVFKTCDYETKKEKNGYCMQVISKRLKDFGIDGFLNHLYYKGVWVLGDGTFYWQREGGFFLEDYSVNDSSLQKAVREYYYDNGVGNNKKHLDFMGIVTGIWFLVLCFIVFMPFSVRKAAIKSVLTICLSILGCVMFTLLFEGRSRYIINYLPFMVFIAASGICGFAKFISGIGNKKEN